MAVDNVAIRSASGTHHVYAQLVGVAGCQFIRDPLDYGTPLHRISIDSADQLKAEDLRQAAVIMASMLRLAANRDEALPLPSQPQASDPFEYPPEDD